MSKIILGASLVAQMVKNLLAKQETQVRSLGREDSLEKATNSKLLPGEFHGQRSLAGCSPWGCKELDMTERPTRVTYPYVFDPSKLIFYKILDNLKLLTVELFITQCTHL